MALTALIKFRQFVVVIVPNKIVFSIDPNIYVRILESYHSSIVFEEVFAMSSHSSAKELGKNVNQCILLRNVGKC
jgi:hypothetical protein